VNFFSPIQMHRLVAALLLSPLLLLGFPAVANAATEQMKAGVFSPPRMAPEISLQGSNGSELKLAQHRGKVVVMAFGFTHCPEVCPTTLAVLAQARKQLGANASQMQVVYVTVDPERDSAAHMKSYLANFDTSFIGGTGRPEALAAVRKAYGITATKVAMPSGGYAYDHSSSAYLIDREGKLRAMMPYGRTADDFTHDVALLLQQPAAGK
jgi:protein SCO1/2